MRIVYLSASAELGGAERLLLSLFASLRRAAPELEMHLVAPASGPLLARAKSLGVQSHIVPMPESLSRIGESNHLGKDSESWMGFARRSVAALPTAGRYVRSLRATLKRISADVVHSNGIKTHLASALARPAGASVWHIHDFLTSRPLTSRLIRLAARRVSTFVAVSQAVAADIGNCVTGQTVVTIPNAVDLSEFTFEGPRADLDRLAGLPAADGPVVRIGLVAAYAKWKGHDVYLDAAALVARQSSAIPIRFYIIGGPIYRTRAQWTESELRQRAERLGLAPRIGFVPFQESPSSAYRALDVVVHASIRPEPFGLTIAEAMGCGRAVIVSPIGGAAELFTDGHDALAVPPNRPQALAHAIERLAIDDSLRRHLGQRGQKSAAERFDSARLGPDFLRVYRDVVDPR